MIFFNILFILFFSCKNLIAGVEVGTAANTVLTNTVYIIGDNASLISNVNTNVKISTNNGGEFTYVSPDKYGYRGVTNWFELRLKNWGNAVDTYKLLIKYTNYSSIPTAGSNWYSGFVVNGIDANIVSVTNGKTNSINFYIIPALNALAGSWGEFFICAQSSNAQIINNTTVYTGDNGNIYGGPSLSGIGVGTNGGTYIDINSNSSPYVQNNASIRITLNDDSIHYVSAVTNQNNPGAALSPYSNPAEAASNIQDAIDVAENGDKIVIIDGYKNYDNCIISYKTNLVFYSSNSVLPCINGKSSVNDGIYITRCSNITVKNIIISNCNSSGLRVESGTRNSFFSNIMCKNNSVYGLLTTWSYNNTYDNCVFFANSTYGVYLGTQIDDTVFKNCRIESLHNNSGFYINNSTDIVITNSVITKNHGRGFRIYRSDRVHIVNNRITLNTNHGIRCESSSGGDTDILIRDNDINSNAAMGISLGGTKNSKVERNKIIYNNSGGISLDNSCNNVYIISNLISGNDDNTGEDNAITMTSVTNIKIFKNTIESNIGAAPNKGIAIGLGTSSTVCKDIIISYNLFNNNTQNIRIKYGTDITIFKNIFFKGSQGILMHDNEPVNVRVLNNTFLSNNTGFNGSDGSVVVKNCIFYGNAGRSLYAPATGSFPVYNSFIGGAVDESAGGSINITNCITNGMPGFKSINFHSQYFCYLDWNSQFQNYGYSNPNKNCPGRYSEGLYMDDETFNAVTSHYIFFTTSLSNYTIPANGLIKVEYIESGNLTTDFDFTDVTNAIATNGFSGAGANFLINSKNANSYTLQIISGTPNIPGQTELIKISSIKNPPQATASTNYQIRITIMSNNGTVIDGPFIGNFFFVDECSLSIIKSISNIRLAGSPSSAVPGSSVEYEVEYSVSGKARPYLVIINDKLFSSVVFKTNFSNSNGFQFEISTNENPDYTWNSVDFTSVIPVNKNTVKHIRWKKKKFNFGESGYLHYSVILK